MLDPIPIIFVLTALVGLVVIVVRHLPELKRADSSNPKPSWAEGFSAKSIVAAVYKNTLYLIKQTGQGLRFAKTEFKNSRDIAHHLSDAVRNKLERKKTLTEREDVKSEELSDELAEAIELFDKGQYANAEEEAIAILKDDPTYLPAYEFLGQVYMARKNWLEAAEVYRYLIKKSPKNDKYWKALGDSLMGLEDYQEAKRSYHKSLEFYASPEVYVSLGLAYQAFEDFTSSIKAFESALDLEPENIQVLMLLAQNLIRCNEAGAAEEVLEQVLELEPDNVMARERLMQLKVN